MRQAVQFTESDEGKRVVDANGETVGRIVEVRHGTASVDPEPALVDTLKATLGWGDTDEETYPLQRADVADVTGTEIQLRH